MKESHPDIQIDSTVIASEPVAVYDVPTTSSAECTASTSLREQVLANTVSVDKYFDELISLVRHDYADL